MYVSSNGFSVVFRPKIRVPKTYCRKKHWVFQNRGCRTQHEREGNLKTKVSRCSGTPGSTNTALHGGKEDQLARTPGHTSVLSSTEYGSVGGVDRQLLGISKNEGIRASLHDHQLEFFSSVWGSSTVDIVEQGGCIEVRPTMPSAAWLSRPASTFPLLKSTSYALLTGFNISYLTPFQLSTMCCYLGRRDLLLLGRPGSGKSVGSLISIIELVTRRAIEASTACLGTSGVTASLVEPASPSTEPVSKDKSVSKNGPMREGDAGTRSAEGSYGSATDTSNSKLIAVVVCPTWETVHLMTQQCSKLLRGHPLGLRCGYVSGGDAIPRELEKLRNTDRPHILFGTPGRLIHHIRYTTNFSKKLRQARFLVIDEASNCLSSLESTDAIRVLRRYFSSAHQTILLSSFADERLKRMAFRMLRTNFMFVNTLEHFDTFHRFRFEQWLQNTAAAASSDAGSVADNAETSGPCRFKVIHPNRIQMQRERGTSEPPVLLNAKLIAAYLTDTARRHWPPRVLSTVAGLTNVVTPCEMPPNSAATDPTEEQLSQSAPENMSTNVPLSVDPEKAVEEPEAIDLWLTRTTETALRSAACPTPPHVTVNSFVYDPRRFIPTLLNIVYGELAGEITSGQGITETAGNAAGSSASVALEATDKPAYCERKILVLFTTTRAVEFYGLLFQRYLHPLSSFRNTLAVYCHGNLTAEERKTTLRLFNESRSAILFASHVVTSAVQGVSAVIQVGSLRATADTVEVTRVFPAAFSTCPGSARQKQGLPGARLLVLVAPIELKYLEELILLRVPLEPAPKPVDAIVARKLPPNIQLALKPSRTVDVQRSKENDDTCGALIDRSTADRHLAHYNPSLLQLNPYTLSSFVSTSSSRNGSLWYENPQVLAACQLMYRSMLGYYATRAEELKIDRDVIPSFLNDQLESAGLCSPPPVSSDFAKRMGFYFHPELRRGPLSLPKLDLITSLRS